MHQLCSLILGIGGICPGFLILSGGGLSVLIIVFIILIITLFLAGIGKNDAIQTSDLEMVKYQPSSFPSMVG